MMITTIREGEILHAFQNYSKAFKASTGSTYVLYSMTVEPHDAPTIAYLRSAAIHAPVASPIGRPKPDARKSSRVIPLLLICLFVCHFTSVVPCPAFPPLQQVNKKGWSGCCPCSIFKSGSHLG